MPYGKEAKEELVKLVQGKCLRVLVYDEDRYGRCVGDIYCNGKFVQVFFFIYNIHLVVYIIRTSSDFCNNLVSKQEVMLKKGLAWHYSAYDQRVELATVSN